MNLLFFVPIALLLGVVAGYSIRYFIDYNKKKDKNLLDKNDKIYDIETEIGNN